MTQMQRMVLSFLGLSGCSFFSEDHMSKSTDVQLESQELSVFYEYATESGVELEQAYQQELRDKRFSGKHIITRGNEEEVGDIDGAIRTLEAVLGSVEIVDITTAENMWKYLVELQDPIATVHSFGHGFDYVLTGKNDEGIHVEDVLAISPAQKRILQGKFTDDAYWKLYTCHGAADNGYMAGQHIAKTLAETLKITTIAANAWVFIETTDAGVFMYPASRSKHKEEFEMHHKAGKYLGIDSVDSQYTQKEAAWITFVPRKSP